MRVYSKSKRFGGLVVVAAAAATLLSAGSMAHAATIVAQDQNAFFGVPSFATPGATLVTQYVGAAQNGAFAGESRAALGTSIGEAFTVGSPVNLTDFELNESGGPGTPAGGNVNFIVTFGTLATATNVFTPVSTENATAVASTTTSGGGPANTFEDFKLSTPIPVAASPSGTEYAFVISENAPQDLADDITGGLLPGDATLANLGQFNTTSQGYAGGVVGSGTGFESINNGVGTPSTSLNFVVGGTPFTAVPEPTSLSLLALGGTGLLARRRRSL